MIIITAILFVVTYAWAIVLNNRVQRLQYQNRAITMATIDLLRECAKLAELSPQAAIDCLNEMADTLETDSAVREVNKLLKV